ncbi:hypothetical protein C8F04DRAFT_1188570 [Mycena alexandri]|uniref:Uncharacterized protein n=1 Tax=Mycena alexandri TaxID=1745969 RepID=A0AAD6SJA3_9AGAR|nr:hypothetical protein C8F04DRAFT_1188570 [Mycena alexandri]
MDASAHCRFVDTNVVWPANRFFIPDGGLRTFLLENLRFKTFLVMMAVFPDAYAHRTVVAMPGEHIIEIRARVHEIVTHMNEFRISYEPLPIPAESAWMFHIVLVLIRVIVFDGDRDVVPAMDRRNMDTTEGAVAVAQASFSLVPALTTFLKEKSEGLSPDLDYPQYDIHSRVSNNFVVRTTVEGHNPIVQDDTIGDTARINRILSGWREHSVGCGFKEDHECKPFPMTAQPEEYELAARACGIVAAVDSVHRIVLKKGPTRQSLRTLANRLDNVSAPLERTNFFVKQEEEVLSEASARLDA